MPIEPKPPIWPHTLKAGCAAVLDTISEGLVPVKVIKVTQGRYGIDVEFEVTKTQGAYKKGYQGNLSSRTVVPVGAIKRGQFHPTIMPYNVEVTP